MKRPSVGGFTAAGVLVVAILGGAVGGALVMGGQSAPVAPRSSVTLHQVADETAPSTVPVVDENAAPAADVVQSDPAPVVASSGGSGETATQAADRAATEADRAETAADRAESTTTPKQAPVQSAPVVSDSAPAPAVVEEEPVVVKVCNPGETRSDAPTRDRPSQINYTCVNGQWVESGRVAVTPPVVKPVEGSEPAPAGGGKE